jgi:signal recognition particle subunit SRP54
VQVSEVNKLVNRFVEARKMMEAMAGGGMPGLPGMGAGRRAGSKKPVTSKRKGKKPAPRPAQRRPQPGQQPAAPQIPQTMDDFQLPPELQKMFDENKPKF